MRTTLLLILLILCRAAQATELFEQTDALAIEIKGPLHTLIKNKENRKELPFVLMVGGVRHDVMVRTRGKSRMEVCSFPPMRIRFDDIPAGSPFEGQEKLKLVTHCRESDRHGKDAIQEYAAYRYFELMSEVSLRVRLLEIQWVDTEGDHDGLEPGFLIESIDGLARRLNSAEVEIPAISLMRLNDTQEVMVYIFQYMIGNTDWSLVAANGEEACCHNGKLLDLDEQLYYVPYDFDQSGLVNSSYARPDPSLPISRVTRRLYRGFCLDSEVILDAVRATRKLEPQIDDINSQLPLLSDSDFKKMDKFLGRFFEEMADEQKIVSYFDKRCLD